MDVVTIIGCVVGIIGCVVGVATFTSAQLTKAKQDGILASKLDQCVSGIEEIKQDVKEKNRQIDSVNEEHSRQIAELKAQMALVLSHMDITGG